MPWLHRGYHLISASSTKLRKSTYGGTDHVGDELYRRAEAAAATAGPADLAASVDAWASSPLMFQPGARWHYSRATDVLGRIAEVVSGQPLDEFFDEQILRPLGMLDTSFVVPDAKADRLASLCMPDPATLQAVPSGDPRSRRSSAFFPGDGGLSSTAADYQGSCNPALGKGLLDYQRLVAPGTLQLAAKNNLPGGRDLGELTFGGPSSTASPGVRFGLGFSVVIDPVRTKLSGSRGEIGWGGAASAELWIDPRGQLSALFLTELRPSSTWPIRPRLHQLVYQVLVETTSHRNRSNG